MWGEWKLMIPVELLLSFGTCHARISPAEPTNIDGIVYILNLSVWQLDNRQKVCSRAAVMYTGTRQSPLDGHCQSGARFHSKTMYKENVISYVPPYIGWMKQSR